MVYESQWGFVIAAYLWKIIIVIIITIHPIRLWWFLSLSRVWTVCSGVAVQTNLWQALLATYFAGEAWWGSKGRSLVVALCAPFLSHLLEPPSQHVSTPFLMVFIHCVQFWTRSSPDEGVMLAFLHLCVEHPWILLTAPLFVGTTKQLTLQDVLGQSSIRHSYMSIPAHLGGQHHGWDCWHSSSGKDLSVGDLALPGNPHQGA